MELNIAIVDDTLSDVLRLESFVKNWFSDFSREHTLCGITSYSNGEEILRNFQPKMFQIIFMDIIMNKINGVETAKQLRNQDTELLIVFIAAGWISSRATFCLWTSLCIKFIF